MLIAMLLGLSLNADVLVAGKPAPAMSADSVVKGNEVKSFEAGKVYVVEFWATWCPPCRATVPHLTELQKKFPDATVIGVAGFERQAKDGDGRLKKVTDFVNSQGDKMAYTVVYDGDGSMAKAWMEAAKKNGIPCAFVVDGTGVVSHIGFPDASLDSAVEKAVKAQGKSDKKSDAKSGSKSDSKSDSKTDSKTDSKKASDSKSSSDSDSDFDSASDSQSSSDSHSSSDSKSSSDKKSSKDSQTSKDSKSSNNSNSSKDSKKGSSSSSDKKSGSSSGGSSTGGTSGSGTGR